MDTNKKRKPWNGRVLWRDVPHLYFALNAARQRIYGEQARG